MPTLFDYLTNPNNGGGQPQAPQNNGQPSPLDFSPIIHALATAASQPAPTVAPQGQPMPQQAPQALPPMSAPAPTPAPTDPTQPDNGNDDDITVTGDPWKPPHHRTFLGMVADIVLGAGHRAPHFQREVDKENLEAAMKGFTQNPEQTIRRVAQFDPSAAWSMYNTWQDNARADKAQGRLVTNADFNNQLKFNQIATQALSAAKDPKTFAAMLAVQQRRAAANHIPWEATGLPTEFDPDNIPILAQGLIPPAKREQLEETSDYHDKTDQYRNKKLGITAQHYNNQDSQAATNEAGRNARNANTVDNQNARSGAAHPPKSRVIPTAMGPGMLSADSTKLMVKTKDGFHYYRNTGNGPNGTNWVLVK